MRLVLNMLAGIPTIVIGVFIFTLLVTGHGQSGFAARYRAFHHHAAADRALDRGGAAAGAAARCARAAWRWGPPGRTRC